MGAKTWMIVYAGSDAKQALSRNPEIDRDATTRLAKQLFPKEKLTPLADGDLQFTSPPDDEVYIGCFAGVSIVAAAEFGIDYPSKLPDAFLRAGGDGRVYLHAMHSAADWFAFAIWSNGTLVRSLSLSPDGGILEDFGEHFPFEVPYWAGEHPAIADEDLSEGEEAYPFSFHPLELGEAALDDLFGYYLEGFPGAAAPTVEAESIPLLRYKRSKVHTWWKF